MNIALFGTSADPPTVGHQNILQWLSDRYDLCVVWVSDNPFKSHQAPIEDRIAMVRLLIEATTFLHKNVELHPEISSPRTLLTLEMAKKNWPRAQFTLIVGADIIPQLPSWYQAETLLRQVSIVVIPRQGHTVSPHHLQVLNRWCSSVKVADAIVPGVSSTTYRNYGDTSGMIPQVSAYINQHRLYPCQEVKPPTL